MEFKAGDRVRCTRNIDSFNTKGKIGTVKRTNMLFAGVDFDEDVEGLGDIGLGIEKGHGAIVKYEDLELIEENTDTFTLDDLKVGYLVELRDGSGNMVMESTTGKVLVDESGDWLNLNNYNNDFKFLDNNNNHLDIMKVYGFSPYNNKTIKFTKEDRELFWERKEILNDSEKEYLSNLIKPFRDSVTMIKKLFSPTACKYYIQIRYIDDTPTNFPYFTNKDMYKNMEVDRAYTLEELRL